MDQQHGTLGAVVLSSDFKVLGVVRSLGQRGIPSVVIDNLPRSAWFSRYVANKTVFSVFDWHDPLPNIRRFCCHPFAITGFHGKRVRA